MLDSTAAASEGHVPAATARPETPPFEEIYETYFTYVWRSAHRLGIPESGVDDVVQEVFVVVHRRLAEFEQRSTLKTWLYGITLRVAREHRRNASRRSPHQGSAHEPTDPETLHAPLEGRPDEAAAKAQAVRLVNALLDTLDEEKREAFVLSELEQLSAPEIAEATGVNLNTVYSRIRAARQEFAEAAARHRALGARKAAKVSQ
jgi:RNA polymerase sigma-70 factor (ECF subfamily)